MYKHIFCAVFKFIVKLFKIEFKIFSLHVNSMTENVCKSVSVYVYLCVFIDRPPLIYGQWPP